MSERKRVGAWNWALLVLGGIGLFAFVGAVLMGALANRNWLNYAAALRMLGEALTFAEVDALRASIPDEENSALIMEKLADQLKADQGFQSSQSVLTFGSSDDDDFFSGLPRYRIQPSKDFLAKHHEILNALERLMKLKAGRLELGSDVTDPIARMVPNLEAFRNAGKLAHLAAMMALADGKSTEAERFVVLQFRVANALAENPTLVSRLVQISIHSMAVDSIEQMLRTGEISEANIAALDRELSAALAQSTMRWALLGERALFVELCEAFVDGRYSFARNQSFSGIRTLFTSSQLPTTFARTNQLCGTGFYTRLVKLVDEPLPLLEEAQRVDGEVKNLGGSKEFTKMLFPGLVRAGERNQRPRINVKPQSLVVGFQLSRCNAYAAERCRGELQQLVMYAQGENSVAQGPGFFSPRSLGTHDGTGANTGGKRRAGKLWMAHSFPFDGPLVVWKDIRPVGFRRRRLADFMTSHEQRVSRNRHHYQREEPYLGYPLHSALSHHQS